MDHSRALAHSSESYGLAACFEGYGDFFIDGIGGHNGLGCCGSGFLGICQFGGHGLYACCKLVCGKLHSDNAGGCNGYCICGNSECLVNSLCRLSAGIVSFLTGTCICDSGIYDNRLHLTSGLDDLFIPHYAGCLYDIAGKCSGTVAGNFGINHCHIGTSLIFDTSCGGCCLKTCG